MNYLAHAYLSFSDPEILAGNMITDFVKGRKQYDYPVAIQKGILLHRNIDTFTDNHPATRQLKSFFRPQYRLYSGAFADVVYDHFLAIDTNQFASNDILKQFSARVYETLQSQFDYLPQGFQKILPYMKTYDWLYNYQFKEGIKKSFEGLVRRAVYLKESAIAFDIFNEHYESFQNCYDEFFPQLKSFTIYEFEQLKKY